MAIQTGIFPFTGKLGNMIGYPRGNKFCLRSAPVHVHQTAATRRRAFEFGRASRLGRAMRHAVRGLLDGAENSDTGNALNKSLLAVLRNDALHSVKRFTIPNLQQLQGFAWYPPASLSDVLTIKPTVERDAAGNILVMLPRMEDYNCHPQATHLSVKAVAAHIAPGFRSAAATASDAVLIPVDRPSEPLTLVVPAGKGVASCVLLEVVCCMEEHERLYQLHDARYTAADIIAVLRLRTVRIKRAYAQRLPNEQLPAITGQPADFYRRE